VTSDLRRTIKRGLARLPEPGSAGGATLLIYHRVGGGSSDERDLSVAEFEKQVSELSRHDVVSLDVAVDRLEKGDASPSVVLTFDDGFADVYDHAWPILKEHSLPFTIYLATAYVGGTMRWDGSTAKAAGPGLTWHQLDEMVSSGLCIVANHTHTHARPEKLDPDELDTCNELIEKHLGVKAAHFTYTWGIPVPSMETELRSRFRSASTGQLGRNLPGTDLLRLRRVPVRNTDPIEFFAAKLKGALRAERVYSAIVAGAKRAGAHA
jgi:peptidoglycan/xylan/chitin deacetylase (PgdA/CDA1 family)